MIIMSHHIYETRIKISVSMPKHSFLLHNLLYFNPSNSTFYIPVEWQKDYTKIILSKVKFDIYQTNRPLSCLRKIRNDLYIYIYILKMFIRERK